MLALYVAVPDKVGQGGNISARLSLFVLLGLVLWLAHLPLASVTSIAVVAVSLVVAAGLTVSHLPAYAAFNDDLRDFTSVAAHLPEGATVVPLSFVASADDHPGLAHSSWTRPLIQATGYLVAQRHVVDLSHFQARYDYFITQFRPPVDPFATIGKGREWLSDTTPDVDLLADPSRPPGDGTIDFVLVWGLSAASPAVVADPATRSVMHQLDAAYDLVYTSPRGLAQLYRHR